MNPEIIQGAFRALLDRAHLVTADVSEDVQALLREGAENPIPREQAIRILSKALRIIRDSARKRGDAQVVSALEEDLEELAAKIEAKANTGGDPDVTQQPKLTLITHNGINVGPIRPVPAFQGRNVPMVGGHLRAVDIDLWVNNERLEIHLDQFRNTNGREPDPDELLQIMLGQTRMPGADELDEFEILDLARDIAVNGVQRPPIIDQDGILLDGNRRVSACRFILASDEFTRAEKARVEYLYVWQLSEHATLDDREAVRVALNFPKDYKKPWPDYVRARIIEREFRAMCDFHPRAPGPETLKKIKKDLAKKFGYGTDTSAVNRFLKMVSWSQEFEDYHVITKGRDAYVVKHKANKHFQYFDELSKGEKPGGVAYSLQQYPDFRNIVFDILFQDKFRNWREIRDLKFMYDNEEARESLLKARDTTDQDQVDFHLDRAISIAHAKRVENREVSPNARIEAFSDWLERLPVAAFRDQIKPENLQRLLKALNLVEGHIKGLMREPV